MPMNGQEAFKQLAFTGIIAFIAGIGLLMFPQDARYLKAAYCTFWSIALFGFVVVFKPRPPWARSTLLFLGGVFAVIGIALVLGG